MRFKKLLILLSILVISLYNLKAGTIRGLAVLKNSDVAFPYVRYSSDGVNWTSVSVSDTIQSNAVGKWNYEITGLSAGSYSVWYFPFYKIENIDVLNNATNYITQDGVEGKETGKFIRLGYNEENYNGGLDASEAEDINIGYTNMGGIKCIRLKHITFPGYYYFNVSDDYIYNGNYNNVILLFHYYDIGTGTDIKGDYDSMDNSYTAMNNDNSIFILENTGKWKTKMVILTNVKFGNNENNGTDFRMRWGYNGNIYLAFVLVCKDIPYYWGSIAGSIKNSDDIGIDNVVVNFKDEYGADYTTTDSSGNYTLNFAFPGEHSVYLAEKFSEKKANITYAGQQLTGVDFIINGSVSYSVNENGYLSALIEWPSLPASWFYVYKAEFSINDSNKASASRISVSSSYNSYLDENPAINKNLFYRVSMVKVNGSITNEYFITENLPVYTFPSDSSAGSLAEFDVTILDVNSDLSSAQKDVTKNSFIKSGTSCIGAVKYSGYIYYVDKSIREELVQKKTVASHQNESFPPNYSNDGDSGTRWIDDTSPQYIMYNMGKEYAVEEIYIDLNEGEEYGPETLQVYLCSDDECWDNPDYDGWKLAKTISGIDKREREITVELSLPIGKYLMYYFPSVHGRAEFYETLAYGYPSSRIEAERIDDFYAVKIFYTNTTLSSVDEKNLRIFRWNGTEWVYMGGTVDTVNKCVYITTDYLGTFGLFIAVDEPEKYRWNYTTFSPNGDGIFDEITLSFYNEKEQEISIKIFDTKGRLVKTLVDEKLPVGPVSLTWDGTTDDFKRSKIGVYVYQIVENGKLKKNGIIILGR